jgi:hypothetical protein
VSSQLVYEYLSLENPDYREHPLVKTATSAKTAVNIVRRRLVSRHEQDMTGGIYSTGRVEDIPDSPIQIADFNTWAPAYTGPKFNVIHCDFPYGINSQDHLMGRAGPSGPPMMIAPRPSGPSLRPYQLTLITSAATPPT